MAVRTPLDYERRGGGGDTHPRPRPRQSAVRRRRLKVIVVLLIVAAFVPFPLRLSPTITVVVSVGGEPTTRPVMDFAWAGWDAYNSAHGKADGNTRFDNQGTLTLEPVSVTSSLGRLVGRNLGGLLHGGPVGLGDQAASVWFQLPDGYRLDTAGLTTDLYGQWLLPPINGDTVAIEPGSENGRQKIIIYLTNRLGWNSTPRRFNITVKRAAASPTTICSN